MKQRYGNISHMLSDVILSREGSRKVPQEAASVENGVHLQCPPLLSRAEPITALDPGQNGPLILTIQISVPRENLRRFAGEMDRNVEGVFNALRLFTFLAWMKRQKGARSCDREGRRLLPSQMLESVPLSLKLGDNMRMAMQPRHS